MEASEQINSVINNLAEQLKVPAEYVYKTLIKQAGVNGIIDIVLICMAIAVIGVFCLWLKYCINMKKENNGRTDPDDMSGIGLFILGIMAFLAMVVIVGSTIDLITCFGNPEYWALQKILELVRSGTK